MWFGQRKILNSNQENKIKWRIILLCKESIPARNWTMTHELKSSKGSYWTKKNGLDFAGKRSLGDLQTGDQEQKLHIQTDSFLNLTDFLPKYCLDQTVLFFVTNRSQRCSNHNLILSHSFALTFHLEQPTPLKHWHPSDNKWVVEPNL